MATGTEQLQQQLEAAIDEAADTATAQTETQETEAKSTTKEAKKETETPTQQETKGKEGQTVPYSRFKEVNDKVADLSEKAAKADTLEAQIERLTSSEVDLRTQLKNLESEKTILDRIRGFMDDESLAPHVEAIDKALRGVKEEVESGDKTPEEGEKETQKILQKAQRDLEQTQKQIANDRADLILERVRGAAEKFIEKLPEAFDDSDKKSIGKLWTQNVDWEKIEENPSAMQSVLKESLEATLEEYGEPRGGLRAKLAEIEANTTEDEREPAQTDEQVVQSLLDKEWGNVVEKDGKNVPEMTDAEVESAMAEIMRRTSAA